MQSENRLGRETSPYLLQHASNPVDWYAWGEEALKRARDLDKPILLSVGYSACHWCHVMAHESFEDAEVAALMNEHYVNIKVDREERPDIDQIYQSAHAALTRRNGGWPLTMFLMPDQTPFFGGTYFPKTPSHNMPGFIDLLLRVAEVYRTQRADLERQNEALRAALAQMQPRESAAAELTPAPLQAALRELAQTFDERDGGFGDAPKFPHPTELEFCLRRYAAGHDDAALRMVKTTLTKMAEGGIFDQLGGGFCRYSVDRYWGIPHFEKMLYDQGPMLRLYSDLWRIEPDPLLRNTVAATAGWVMREMQDHTEGGYYSSLDADSEHEEGKFYVWNAAEIKAALSDDEYALIEPYYGLDGAPNFERTGFHLRVMKPLPVIAQRLNISIERARVLLNSARAKLMALRERRVRPGRDEKILTSWNALMIKGMAHAARVHDRAEWLTSARAAARHLRMTLWKNGRLLATAKDGHAHLNAYLDDYAFMTDALLELMQAEFHIEDLEWARELAEVLLDQFEDRDHGGFYFVSHDHERLIHRAKAAFDNATPAGNGVAAFALGRLGHLLGESRYLKAAERTLLAFAPQLERQPGASTGLCLALEEQLTPPAMVVLRGPPDELRNWQRSLNARYRPAAMVFALPAGLRGLPPTLDQPCAEGIVNAYVCHGVKCLPPIVKLAELTGILDAPAA